ncbi:hypothetical protein RHMOL_Rhmol01G0011700 [Rhododendron molle]|uniref:Uncharacterized protein n=1 Tax=Rhododendron molle TaxID=49168 RepID=A0ACC0PXG0_RHOML|nr:hypothetical protein RHMOL_Rhmol01G0011700 [Rhododendron molle]
MRKGYIQNGKLIATVTTHSIILNAVLMFTNSSSSKPRISDLLTEKTLLCLLKSNMTNIVDWFEHIKKDVQIAIGFEFLCLLPCMAISLFSLVTMILASVVAYSDRNLSFGDFLSRIPKSCLRTLVTLFHLIPFTAAVVWQIDLVISLIEKSCYGLQAFGKAEGLVKGKRLHGFTLTLLHK